MDDREDWQNQMNAKDWELEESQSERMGGHYFERIRPTPKPLMPTGRNGRRRSRCGRETTASRANRSRISGQNGGMHHRRRRKLK